MTEMNPNSKQNNSLHSEWHFPNPLQKKGVITGCDEGYEWLLPFWWANYSRRNTEPVTFIDFGLSSKGRDFCRQRGDLVTVKAPNFSTKSDVAPDLQKDWNPDSEDEYWEKRSQWLKKPFAFLMSPYQDTIWLDMDCQVMRSLDPLWEYCKGFGCAEFSLHEGFQPMSRLPDETIYNSGVLCFSHGSAIIEAVAKEAATHHDQYSGDDNILSRILYSKKYSFRVFSSLYNWICNESMHPQATVLHWHGKKSNLKIMAELGMY